MRLIFECGLYSFKTSFQWSWSFGYFQCIWKMGTINLAELCYRWCKHKTEQKRFTLWQNFNFCSKIRFCQLHFLNFCANFRPKIRYLLKMGNSDSWIFAPKIRLKKVQIAPVWSTDYKWIKQTNFDFRSPKLERSEKWFLPPKSSVKKV